MMMAVVAPEHKKREKIVCVGPEAEGRDNPEEKEKILILCVGVSGGELSEQAPPDPKT